MSLPHGTGSLTYQYNEYGLLKRTASSLDQLLSETTGSGPSGRIGDSSCKRSGGNLSAKGIGSSTTEYRYDLQNHLTEVCAPGESDPSVLYGYDYRGSRLYEARPDGTPGGSGPPDVTFYQVDNNNLTGYSQVLAEFVAEEGDESLPPVRKTYTYGHDLVSMTALPGVPGAAARWYHYDGLGSTRALTDETGSATNRYGYSAFGEGVSSLTTQNPSVAQAYRFTGERLDEETGLYHLRARMYDPGIGRFTSFDPADDYQNRLHRYNYCHDEPVGSVDPGGEVLNLVAIVVVLAIMLCLVAILAAYFIWRFRKLGTGTALDIPTERDIQFLEDRIWERYTEGGDTDWAWFREFLFWEHGDLDSSPSDKVPVKYRLDDGTYVSWDKFLHFASGAQIEEYFGIFTIFNEGYWFNYYYELYAMRPGLLPSEAPHHSDHPMPGPLSWMSDKEKPFIYQDIQAGGFGGQFEEEWDHNSTPNISKYFEGQPRDYWMND